eukprot:2219553-Prymnesium_polylepis.1
MALMSNGQSNAARSSAVRPPDEWPPTASLLRSRRPASGPSAAVVIARSSARMAAIPGVDGPRLYSSRPRSALRSNGTDSRHVDGPKGTTQVERVTAQPARASRDASHE